MFQQSRYHESHRDGARLGAVQRAVADRNRWLSSAAAAGRALVVRCAAALPATQPADLVPGAVVDGNVELQTGDRVLLMNTNDDDVDALALGVWEVRGGGPVRPTYNSVLGRPLATPPATHDDDLLLDVHAALGTVVQVVEGAEYGASTFACVEAEAEADPAVAPPSAKRRRRFVAIRPWTTAAAVRAVVVGLNDLMDAVHDAEGGTVALGRTNDASAAPLGPRNTLVGPDAGSALASTAAADNTIVGNHTADDDPAAAGRVVIADGAGNAALAAVPARGATRVGPRAERLFTAANGGLDAAADATWVGGPDDAVALRPGAVLVADGAGGDLAVAAEPARGNAWFGPGCKRLLADAVAAGDAAGAVRNSVWLGGAADDGVAPPPADAVVVADGTGAAVLAARPARGAAWFGPSADRLLLLGLDPAATPRGLICLGAPSAAEAAATAADAAAHGGGDALLVADGAGDTVWLRAAATHTLQLGPDDAPAPAAGSGTVVTLGRTRGTGVAGVQPEVALATGGGDHRLWSGAAGAAALGRGACSGLLTAAASSADLRHTVVGSVAWPAAGDGAVVLSSGAGLGLYADADRLWLGAPEATATAIVPPDTPVLPSTPAGATGLARHGVWLGRATTTAAGTGPDGAPVTIADPGTGAVRWRADAAGRVSWSVVPRTVAGEDDPLPLPAAPDTAALFVEATVDAAGAVVHRYATLCVDIPSEGGVMYRDLGPFWPPEVTAGIRDGWRTLVWDASNAASVGLTPTGTAVAFWTETSASAADRVPPALAYPYNAFAAFAAGAGATAVGWGTAADLRAPCPVFAGDGAMLVYPYRPFADNVARNDHGNRRAPPQLSQSTVLVAMRPAFSATAAATGDTVLTVLSKHPTEPADASTVAPRRYRTAFEVVLSRTAVGDAGGTMQAQIRTVDDSGQYAVVFRSPTTTPAGQFTAVAYRVAWDGLSVYTDGDGGRHTDVGEVVLYDPTPDRATEPDADVLEVEYRMADANRYALCLGGRRALADDNGTVDGAGGSTVDAPFGGHICEVRVVPEVLSDAAIATQLAALRTKWHQPQ